MAKAASRITSAWQTRGLLAWALLPLALIFGLLAVLRRSLFRLGLKRVERLPVAVLVVGNITVGGAGKTPLTLFLAQEFRRLGRHPAIVSRGYGGSAAATGWIGPVASSDDAARVGDEPLLLARRAGCPVWIGRDRVAAGRALLQAHPETDLILTDDGLQHYRLGRDLEIVVMDQRGVGNGWLMPAGPLREPVSRIRRAHALVINGATLPPGVAGLAPTFAMTLAGSLFRRLDDPSQTCAASAFAGQPLHALAGIGHPQRFFDHLAALGIVAVHHPFPDHHHYCAADLDFGPGAVILMTEKDAVKCAALAPPDSWVLQVDAQLTPDLAQFLLEKLNGRPAA